ncbi:MAG: AEC family transporter [Eubacteriales bacterium]|nr:AEC family transporter [Eubacteriales bacterium]
MENFFIALNAVMPLAIYIVIGIGIKKFKLAEESLLKGMNAFVYKMFFPVMMFSNIYKTDFAGLFDPMVVFFALGATIVYLAVLCVIVPRAIKSRATAASYIQAAFRGNIVIFGLPLAGSVLGAENVGPVSIVCAFMVPFYNVAVVLLFEYFCSTDEKSSIKDLAVKVAKNPLIIGAAAGILYNMTGLPTPQPVAKVISDISSATTVISLIILGASLQFSSVGANLKYLISGCALKLIIFPGVTMAVSVLLNIRGANLFGELMAFGTPVAVSSYVMAYNMGADHQLAAQFVAFSTIASVFTIFMWVYLLLNFGMI